MNNEIQAEIADGTLYFCHGCGSDEQSHIMFILIPYLSDESVKLCNNCVNKLKEVVNKAVDGFLTEHS